MKKRFLSAIFACGLSLAAADPFFNTAIKEVDMGGEYLNYRNLTSLMAFLQQEFPEIVLNTMRASGEMQNENSVIAAKNILNTVLKLMALQDIKAAANSSVKISPELYIFKSALVIAPGSKSILFTSANKNHKLNYMNMPENTRFAISAEIDMASIWQQIKKELSASQDPAIRNGIIEIENLKQQGIDLDAPLAAINGNFFLMITGNDITDLAFELRLPDCNGALSAKLKSFLPPMPNTNYAVLPIPMPSGVQPQLTYAKGEIIVNAGNAANPPAKKLADNQKFQNFSRHLPVDGTGFMVLNIPRGLTDTVNTLLSLNPQMPKINLEPFSLIVIGKKTASGYANVAASDFSFMQVEKLQLKTLFPLMQQIKPAITTSRR